jgi:hypothetical protein
MVRLLAIRAAIAGLKRAIWVSDRLRPSTWEFFAICCAALFALSAWGLLKSQPQDIRSGASNLKPQAVDNRASTLKPYLAQAYLRREWWSQSDVSVTLSAADTAENCAVYIRPGSDLYLSRSDNSHAALRLDIPLMWSVVQFGRSSMFHHRAFSAPFYYASTSLEDMRFVSSPLPELPALRSLFRQPPTVVYQPAAREGVSSSEELRTWVLFIMALSGHALAWLGYNQVRRERSLRRLERVRMELEIERGKKDLEKSALEIEKLKLEVQLARQEADKPRILLD